MRAVDEALRQGYLNKSKWQELKSELKNEATACNRLFANRRRQSWPSEVNATEEWRIAYDRTKGTLPVLPTIDEAVIWVNELIAKIAAVKGSRK